MAGIRIQFFLRTHIHVRIRDHLCMGAWEHGSMRACVLSRAHVEEGMCARTRVPLPTLSSPPPHALTREGPDPQWCTRSLETHCAHAP